MLDSILGTKAKVGKSFLVEIYFCTCTYSTWDVPVEILLVGFNFFNGEDFFIVSPLPEVYIII